MLSAFECRLKAQQAESLAAKSVDSVVRKTWSKAAEHWADLAARAEHQDKTGRSVADRIST